MQILYTRKTKMDILMFISHIYSFYINYANTIYSENKNGYLNVYKSCYSFYHGIGHHPCHVWGLMQFIFHGKV